MYSTKNYLRSFEVVFHLVISDKPRKFTILTKYLFDASSINEVFQLDGVIEILNSLIPFTDCGSPSHYLLEDLISLCDEDSFISSYFIKTFKIK